MLAVKQERQMDLVKLADIYLSVSALRSEILFRHFLPEGYRQTTLNTVPVHRRKSLVLAKVHLGMLITLYDDFADRPDLKNPDLIERLYTLNIEKDHALTGSFSLQEKRTFDLARFLFADLTEALFALPNYAQLKNVLKFDLEHFFLANRHAELIGELPQIRNFTEMQSLGPYNMGIVAAGTIDLMAAPNFAPQELGRCREIFLLGQRMGRISNLLFTLPRELAENDLTNEILLCIDGETQRQYQSQLLRKFCEGFYQIRNTQLSTFSTKAYARGLVRLHRLHADLAGKI